jgi:hypothetical protein
VTAHEHVQISRSLCELCEKPADLDDDGLCDGCAQTFWVDVEPAPRPVTTINVAGGLL